MRTLTVSILFLCLGGIAQAAGRHNEMLSDEKSIEAMEFKISATAGSGYILTKECATCPVVRLNVTTSTRAFFNNKSVPLSQVPALATSITTVVYDLKTMNAKRIYW